MANSRKCRYCGKEFNRCYCASNTLAPDTDKPLFSHDSYSGVSSHSFSDYSEPNTYSTDFGGSGDSSGGGGGESY